MPSNIHRLKSHKYIEIECQYFISSFLYHDFPNLSFGHSLKTKSNFGRLKIEIAKGNKFYLYPKYSNYPLLSNSFSARLAKSLFSNNDVKNI